MKKKRVRLAAAAAAWLVFGGVCSMIRLPHPVCAYENAVHFWNGHRYCVFDENVSWTEARIRCSLIGGHLVTISDADEQQYVEELIADTSHTAYWIGLYRQTNDWNWIDGSVLSYTNWDFDSYSDTQKPDNAGGMEQFGCLYAKTAKFTDATSCNLGKWDDNPDNGKYEERGYCYVCEWDTESDEQLFGTDNGILVWENHTYQLMETGLTWKQAKAACEEVGGHLATVGSIEEQKALNQLMDEYGDRISYWIGGTDAETEGEWKWITDEPFSYINWIDGEPDNSTDMESGGENYLAMYRGKHGSNAANGWADDCDTATMMTAFGYICEWDNDSDAVLWNGHVYKVFHQGFTWDQARACCELMGGHLVTVTSAMEQETIQTLFQSPIHKNNYWMGAKVRNAQIFWVTGEAATYSNWAAGQPDNAFGIGEDSLMLYLAHNPRFWNELYQWNDLREDGSCNQEPFFGTNNFGFICEWDDSTTAPVYILAYSNLIGDVNCDGVVDIADAVLLARYMTEDPELVLSERGIKNADANHDSFIANDDIVTILKMIAKIIN